MESNGNVNHAIACGYGHKMLTNGSYKRVSPSIIQLQSENMNPWTLWIILASIPLIALTKAKDDVWQRKIPIKFLKAVMEQPTLCESGYADYDSCENSVTTNSVKSRISNDVYEYNSEEVNMDKIIGDVVPVEEKRSHSRAGCDSQLSTTIIDLGPASFPRHVRNVTCDEHKRCYHARAKGLHCLPIHYQVSVLKMRDYRINPSEQQSETHTLPQGLRCCWKAVSIPTVVGCVCGPHY